ncbi:hypothetical protein CM19_01350 [Candidatus Acidianus copahuensis]|uniref:Uncharacterized protein n=1 Tax=Candidatus Acidianus copahuensis TaxID=1160895 RepID=A0A031LV35_9CREN|nr:hypothetical protein [Candidatus Acidianus copahuensis]EZQ11364.1 hypothetical protein CM19_01350 [Candidatus Acidianus copahuensis]
MHEEKQLEDNLYEFLLNMSRKEEEIDFSIINFFGEKLKDRGISLPDIRRETVIDDIDIVSLGYPLTIIYYKDDSYINVFLPKNYADSSTIEQLLIRLKYIKQKFSGKVRGYILCLSIPEKYKRLAESLGIEVFTEKILK